ncbi:zinc finger protein 2 isoform X2 [Aplysia californica]|uniref:Zinc finger protein 2 isoform X2 n=1 Tax=Aplysia californica TaxID=6500 RepID=A0ABM0K897_APLCA|nr:zinc finger protein 2 isoform X2 [Aplysia californica]
MEARVHKELSTFLERHSLGGSISNIDEIVLSYLLGIMELIGQGEVEDCFDLEDVMEMMAAYLPGFEIVDRSSVMEWMFSLSSQLAKGEDTASETACPVKEEETEQRDADEHNSQTDTDSKILHGSIGGKDSKFPSYDFTESASSPPLPQMSVMPRLTDIKDEPSPDPDTNKVAGTWAWQSDVPYKSENRDPVHIPLDSTSTSTLEAGTKRSVKQSSYNHFYQKIAPQVMSQLGEPNLGEVSKVTSKMWQSLDADTRKEWRKAAQRHRQEVDSGLAEREKCEHCGAEYKNHRSLVYHQKYCQPMCPECGDVLKDRQALLRHQAKEHKQSHQCEICGKNFQSRWLLKRHSTVHTKQAFKCSICNVECNVKSNLIRHMKNMHS